ncbi:MAG: hypothetical protein JWL77_1851 [Chthonomonadaceae bacterium]|nr:hypothetical protein [Chthonomonadaceae bacterium]
MKQNDRIRFPADRAGDQAIIPEDDSREEPRRAVSRRDAMRLFTVAGISSASALAGCGGASNTATTAGNTGRATLAITWPARTTTRLIPVAANSIVISFLQGTTVVATQTIARPTTGTSSTVTFPTLPAGALTLQATSYPNSDGTGVAQATATSSVTIVAGQNTALGITMASTIASLGITPTSPSITVSGTTQLAMTALDSSGHIVLTSASTISWASGSPGIATVSSTGLVTGVAAGNATITATESESGKIATISVTVTTAAAHAVTPEGEIGPYFTDDSASGFNRSNILSNLDGTNTQTGIPLVLSIYVYDTENGNAALSGCQVDIWHCNAAGLYSNESVENTLGQTWLRGYQVTDTGGLVKFTTIFPGWYQGRTTHIHLRVRSKYSQASSTSDGTNTTQLFFPQATVDYLANNVAPYKSEGVNSTTNANDHVYTPETHAQTQLTLTGDYTTSYAATVAIYLPITAE